MCIFCDFSEDDWSIEHMEASSKQLNKPELANIMRVLKHKINQYQQWLDSEHEDGFSKVSVSSNLKKLKDAQQIGGRLL